MAGGIFVDQPYHPNPKCLVVSAILVASYWYLPANRNPLMAIFLFIASYVALAWYDYMYHCDTKMYSGSFPGPNTLDSVFKPDATTRPPGSTRTVPNQQHEYLKHVYLFHVALVAPMLIYVGYNGAASNPHIWSVVLGFGIMALLYHGYRLAYPRA